MADITRSTIIESIAAEIDGVEVGDSIGTSPSITSTADSLLALGRKLKSEASFDLLHSISGVDHPDMVEVAYHLFATQDQRSVVIKVFVSKEQAKVPTVTDIWVTADWHERETAELYGVEFSDHHDPRRLLLAEDFPGFPLRKEWSHDNLEEYLLE